jgi:hypothetical protein
MGQIQSSVSGLVASAIGAKVATEIKEEKIAKSQKEQYIKSVEGLPKAELDLYNDEQKSKKIEGQIGKLQGSKSKKASTEIQKRQLSLNVLRGKIEARKMQIQGYKDIISRFEGGQK